MGVMVKLSNERGEQLRSFAEAHGLGVTEAIGALLKKAGAADKVPGFEVAPIRFEPGRKAHAHTIIFGRFNAILSTENLCIVADHLEHCAATSGTGGHEITLSIKGKEVGLLTVARYRRHSVAIAGKMLPDGETVVRILTLDVARDLAGQFRQAAAAA